MNNIYTESQYAMNFVDKVMLKWESKRCTLPSSFALYNRIVIQGFAFYWLIKIQTEEYEIQQKLSIFFTI